MRTDIFEVIFMENKEKRRINYSKIAKQYDCDPRTVKRYFNARDENPTVRKPREIKRLTDGLEDIIEEKYVIHHAPAIAIYNLLVERYKFKGSYTTIKTYTHELKEKKINEATIRFETSPGLQCQIDWKESLTLLNKQNKPFTINIFLSILGFSRLKYIELTLDKSQSTLFRCLTNAIKYFGGVPKEFLFDNMKTVVDRSRTQFDKPIYNQVFYSFSKMQISFQNHVWLSGQEQKGRLKLLLKLWID